jgi:putative transposase
MLLGPTADPLPPVHEDAPKVRLEIAELFRALVDDEPSCGYRTLFGLYGISKNTVQRVFQSELACPEAARPRIEALHPAPLRMNERWAPDL